MEDLFNRYPIANKRLCYGTAGFRDRFDLPLHGTFARMGVLGCLRSLSQNGGCIGVMITASHNPECDNGIKIVDYDGGMLSQSWEPYAEQLANAPDFNVFNDIVNAIKISIGDLSTSNIAPIVMIGRDTRPHSNELAACVRDGIRTFGGVVMDLGECTTPQLHYCVELYNSLQFPPESFDRSHYLNSYYEKLLSGYVSLKLSSGVELSDNIVIDGSAGVGAKAIKDMTAVLATLEGNENRLTIDLRNDISSGPVNEGCGAELVQKSQVPPKGVNPIDDNGKTLCSFDGDADRIVFHSFLPNPESPEHPWILLDGDKIAALISLVLSTELVASGLPYNVVGVVQTAYANGASTRYLQSQDIQVVLAKTGVKYLHHKAVHSGFDAAVYFEANGHGTVLFSARLMQLLSNALSAPHEVSDRQALAIQRLQACVKVINQTVGDAISDMLFCLAGLKVMKMTLADWNALYTDLPSRQVKVAVANKALIACSEDETTVVAPAALQRDLDAAMAATAMGRCFVRPSGTEDIVRIYAEAQTQALADDLAAQAVEAIKRHIN